MNLLAGAGIGVIDLGIDVPKEEFVKVAEREGAKVIGLSALLSTTITYTREIVDAFQKAGLREKVKIIIGGAAATEDLAKEMGADAYAPDAVIGVRMIENWLNLSLIPHTVSSDQCSHRKYLPPDLIEPPQLL